MNMNNDRMTLGMESTFNVHTINMYSPVEEEIYFNGNNLDNNGWLYIILLNEDYY